MGDVDDSATPTAEQVIDEVIQDFSSDRIIPPPYFMNWQRIAVKEIAQLLVELGSGCHMSIAEFTEAMESVTSQVQEYAYSVRISVPPTLPPSNRPEVPSIFEDF